MVSVGIARRTQFVVAAGAAFAAVAMLRYPGGTALDSTTRGYSLSLNFLSDLGMTVAYNHEPNRLGATFFCISLLLLIVGLGSTVGGIARFLAADVADRAWARAAAAAVLVVCAAFAGVAVTPENRFMSLHVEFTLWAWRVVPIAALLMGIASRRCRKLRARAAVAWLVAALLLAAYAGLLTWGPNVGRAGGLLAQVIAQKTATVVVIVVLSVAAREIDAARQAGSTPTPSELGPRSTSACSRRRPPRS
jgi:hypothetical membrane protein